MTKILIAIGLVIAGLVVAVPVAYKLLVSSLAPTATITQDAGVAADDFSNSFGAEIPDSHKGGFVMDISFLGIYNAKIVTVIPRDTNPEEIFEGGEGLKFNPGPHTIAVAVKATNRDSEDDTRRNLQRMLLGNSDSDGQMTQVFIPAGGKQIAAYESRTRKYGQSNLNYFYFLDGGEMIFVSGPEDGFDQKFNESLAGSLGKAHPANELLYAHVEAPTRDIHHPCGFERLPAEFEIQAVGIQSGSTKLEGVAIDPEDDDATLQVVAVGRTEAPLLLVLMAGTPNAWKVMTTPDAQIAGVIASGRNVQRVIGLPEDVPLKEIDPNDRNGCKPFFADQSDGYEFDQFEERIFEVFAQPLKRMRTRHGGQYFQIGDVTAEPALRGNLELDDVIVDPSVHLLPGKLGLAQLRDRGVIRAAQPADFSAWADGLGDAPGLDVDRLRQRTDLTFRMQKAFKVTAQTDLPPGMFGANSALFLVENGVPDPGGDRGHNTLLFADGRCIGPNCR